MKEVTCKETRVTQTDLVLPNDTNNHNTLFGGILMKKIDAVASISAKRLCRQNVVTASTDSVDFLSPVTQQDSICLESFVTWTGNRSMEVFVKVVAENLRTGERRIAATAFLTFVAVGYDGQKCENIPQIVPESKDEKMLFDTASERAEIRKIRKERSKELASKITIKRRYQIEEENRK